MKCRKYIQGLSIYLFLWIPFIANGQFNHVGEEYKEVEAHAKDLMLNEQFYLALPIYHYLDSLLPNNPKYIYPLGVCYLNKVEEAKALSYFEKCLKEPSKYPDRLYYYTGKAYHLQLEFDKALANYEIYKTLLVKAKKKSNKALLKEVYRDIEMCHNGKELIAKPLDITINNLGSSINSPFPEHGPILSADESVLIFTSGRPTTTGGHIDKVDGQYFEDIYISHKTDTGWSTPLSIGDSINTSDHDASISLSADGQKLLLYKSEKEYFGLSSQGNLYVSELKGIHWTKPVKLPSQICTKNWEPSASISADEKFMIFSSNRPGGFGGLDLYIVKKLPNGQWALPMNLGGVINSPYDEDAPFIHHDSKTLYFSSNGHKSMGGFDIFMSKFDLSTFSWSEPENIGYPISTAHDDMHFSWTADGKKIYFSTTRPEGFGDRDIYYSEVYKEAAKLVVLKGIISDSLTAMPLDATIKVLDSKNNEVIGIFNSNSSTGKYIVILPEGKNYNFSITSQNYNVCVDVLNFSNLEKFEEIEKNIKLCPKYK